MSYDGKAVRGKRSRDVRRNSGARWKSGRDKAAPGRNGTALSGVKGTVDEWFYELVEA